MNKTKCLNPFENFTPDILTLGLNARLEEEFHYVAPNVRLNYQKDFI